MLRKLGLSTGLALALVMLSLGVTARPAHASDALQTWLFNVEGMT